MERLPGLKILGKIKVLEIENKKPKEKLRSQEQILSAVNEGMLHSVPLVNERAASFEDAPNPILDEEGRINMNVYFDVYGKKVVDFDKNNAYQQKRGFYQTYTREVQEKYGTTDENQIIETIKKKERMRDGNISEEALFLLMNKIGGDRYLAVRSCEHDDFIEGTDLLLIDTVTGKTICAFDETVEGVNSRLDRKIQRAKDKLLKGRGMQVKYGMSFLQSNDKKSRMKLGKIKNIPPLFLSVNKKTLEELLQNMDFRIDSDIGESEEKIVSEIISSIDSQISDLETASQGNVSYDSVKSFMDHLKLNLEYVSEIKKAG